MKRNRALLELARIGAQELENTQSAEDRDHLSAVNALSAFAGTFPAGYLADLRNEWPK
jgi:hypothetical protein